MATKSTKIKKTAAEWQAAKATAAKITGYGSGSLIWGKTDATVFADMKTEMSAGHHGAADLLLDELIKREAYKRLVATL